MTTVGKLVVSALSVCFLSSLVLLTSSAEVPLSTCPTEGSVCNIGVRNGTGVTLRQQCLCSDGRKCPSNFDQKDGAILVEENWLVTCSPTELLPVCQPGQLSVLALSEGAEDGVNFQVLCVCPTPYTPGSATKEFGGVSLKVFIYCTSKVKGYQNSTENIDDEAIQILNNEVSPISDESNLYYLPVEDSKRSRGNTAFYKRDATFLSHKRRPAGYSAFYKRDRNHLSSFYKRTPFPKQASFYKRKRSVEDSFDNETPVDIGILNEDLPPSFASFDKKDFGLNSFYKRGLGREASSFYKRGGYGVSSFYKRTPEDESSLYSLDDDESDDFMAPDEDSEDVTSIDKEAVGHYLSPNHKRSVSSFYKRVPWYNKEGASSFYKKRELGGRNSAFYKRDDSSEENVLDKRATGRNLSFFYKRSRNNPNISRFYKRYSSNTGSTHGISSFYKRRFGDTSNFYRRGESDVSNFYKRGASDSSNFYERGASGVSNFYKRGIDDSSFYNRGLSDVSGLHKKDRRHLSRFYKRDIGGVSSFYKRGPGSEFAFYKRGLGDVSNFYKRGSGDLSNFYKRGFGGVSNFYKRGSEDSSNFYKRGDGQYSFYKRNADVFPTLFTDYMEESEQANKRQKRSVFPNEYKKQTGDSNSKIYKRAVNDVHAFYKRGSSDESIFSFYKRSPYDNSISNFYKRVPYDHSSSSFYKRVPYDHSSSSFYKRVPYDHSSSSFYKRVPYDHSSSSFYKRVPYDHSSSSFYKRTNDINAFYKRVRGSNTVSNFYKRFGQDLNAFYKRSPHDLQAFYKRSQGDGRSIDDLENLLHHWRENDIAKLYNENLITDHTHTDSESIENAVDTDPANHLGDSRQQIKQNLP